MPYQSRPLFQVCPVMDLREHTVVALEGAAYHLDRIRRLLASQALQTNWRNDPNLEVARQRALNAQQSHFCWHLRAFFWELVATFDTMLQWANRSFDLGLLESQVRWSDIQNRSSPTRPTEWATTRQDLQTLYESELFWEITQYRNFAHRAFTLVHSGLPVEGRGVAFTFLEPVRQGQRDVQLIESHLTSYLNHMRVSLTIIR
jgi:hypothetical protein